MKIKGFKLGATGHYPAGKVDATDEGELQMAIAADRAQGIVRIEFGKPIAWLGLASGDARQFAALLLQKADDVDRAKA